jgi:hypothetical protein
MNRRRAIRRLFGALAFAGFVGSASRSKPRVIVGRVKPTGPKVFGAMPGSWNDANIRNYCRNAGLVPVFTPEGVVGIRGSLFKTCRPEAIYLPSIDLILPVLRA